MQAMRPNVTGSSNTAQEQLHMQKKQRLFNRMQLHQRDRQRGDYTDRRGDYTDRRGDYTDWRSDYTDWRGDYTDWRGGYSNAQSAASDRSANVENRRDWNARNNDYGGSKRKI
ncbi:hypothetical protein DPMN_133282 [Dreissena polymorpha]|uniref:Uncharacterized protein n=1 Tax=Dreissena polymorpha TaxID=45954 RepID=A0A9D4FY54_DREPO|nr:hypothetical protein DPMN_133282 [Dreissena polymorpha]